MSIWTQYTIYILVVAGAYWFGYLTGGMAASARYREALDRHFNNK